MSNATILVVEDEGIIAENLRRVLVGFGYQVLPPVSRGEEAVEVALHSRPDLALIDIKLAGEMDGVETAEIIGAQIHIPIVYLTAYSEDLQFKRAQRTEPYGYLVKPVKEPELYATLELALYKHRVDRQIKESEEKFRQVTENIHELFWLYSRDTGKMVYVSPAYEDMFGQTREQAYQDPDSFFESVHKTDWQWVMDAKDELVRNHIPFDMEYRINSKDHSVRWVRSRAYPVVDSSGRVYRFSGIVEDITERKMAEQEKDALIEISQLFIEAHSIDDIYSALPHILAERFQFPFAAIELYDSEGNDMVYKGMVGLPPHMFPLRVPVGQTISGTVLRSGLPVVEMDVSKRPEYQYDVMRSFDARAFLCIPLKNQDAVLGVLTLADPNLRNDLERTAPTMQIIANHLSQEIIRKRFEEALRSSEARLQEANRIARLGRWDFDLINNRLHWSDTIYELFEISPDQFTPSYDNFMEFVHPDDRDFVHTGYSASIMNMTPYYLSHRLLTKSGKIKWVNEVGRTEYDSQGNALRSYGIVQDVTELKQAEERQRQLYDTFTKVFQTSPDSISITRLNDGLYIDINEGYTRLTGYTQEDVRGKTSADIDIWVNAEDREKLVQAMRERGEVKNLEAPFRLKNGEIRYGLMSAKFIEVNNDRCVLSVTRDITERKQAEEMLRATTEELRVSYDATLKGWSGALELREGETAGHSQRVVKFTLELAKILGISSEEMVHMERGALLHDIGKMVMPDSILLKRGPLTESEWSVMRQHPVHAYQLLSEMPFLSPALDIPYCHHERWDGTGYPRGLRGEEIPRSARIFSVIDVWDALLHDRPYRKAWEEEEVIDYLKTQAGKQFDPCVVETFLRLLETVQRVNAF
jgi:PAS domain S-box-containing protein